MGELSEDSESSAPVTAADGSDQQERPKLVALPEPAAGEAEPRAGEPAAGEPEPEPTTAAARADVARLALERSLSGPPAPGPRSAGAPPRAAASATARAASATAPAAPPVAPASGLLAPYAIADALTATPELVSALRAELAMRAHAEAGLRARAVDAETRLAARVLLSRRTAEALSQVRAELGQLAGLLTEERARRQTAEQRVAELERQLAGDRGRSEDADREIASLRDSLLALRAPAQDSGATVSGAEPPGEASSSAAPEVRADRLSDALTRLRAGTEPIDPAPAPAGAPAPAPAPLASVTSGVASVAPRPTLAGPFRTLCRRDPALAGQLALSLLPMQRLVYPQPISYDIVLGPGHGCVQVTSGDDGAEVARQATARPLEQVDLHVVGDPERFAKLLAAGRLRRRLGFGVARVRGRRHGLAALDALLTLPPDLTTLVAGGMSTDPSILLSLAAAIIAPEWTRGARFSISHRDGNAPATYLLIADGRAPAVTTVAPTGAIATVISCAQSDLASALTGSAALEPASVQVVGDPEPLAQVQAWIKRAQSE